MAGPYYLHFTWESPTFAIGLQAIRTLHNNTRIITTRQYLIMKHLIKTTLLLALLLLVMVSCSGNQSVSNSDSKSEVNGDYDLINDSKFEVNGIYYFINGTTATVSFSGSHHYDHTDEYTGDYSGSVTIPATVTHDGTTYSVTIIGVGAFDDCRNLTAINIPNSVTTIGDGAFDGCTGLTAINIPTSVTTIGNSAFSGCSSLATISVASDNPKYDSRNNCNAIIETATNTLIAGCKNTTIPNSVTSIGGKAFSGYSSLTNINIPNSVTVIGELAFDGCSGLTAINIPNSVTTIGEGAFSNCSSLATISVVSDNPKYDSRNNCNAIIETTTNTLIAGCMNTTIPKSVTVIGELAFDGCSSLAAVNIPNSVTSIGRSTFSGCSSLTNINIPNSVSSIGFEAFNGTAWYDNKPDGLVYAGLVAYEYKGDMPEGTSITLRKGTKGIAEYAFADCNCDGLTSINIPNSVTTIGICAFEGRTGLTSINIPTSVTTIGYQTFRGCTSLTTVNIPNSVTTIDEDAFMDCPSLYDVYCYATTPPRCENSCFINYSATLHVPAASLAAYRVAPVWSKFKNIVGDADATNGHRNRSR